LHFSLFCFLLHDIPVSWYCHIYPYPSSYLQTWNYRSNSYRHSLVTVGTWFVLGSSVLRHCAAFDF
jgi:hypothetical protein